MGICFDANGSEIIRKFGFWEEPFSSIADPRFLYYSSDRLAIAEKVIENVRGRKGLIVVEGENGLGKTILARRLHQLFDLYTDFSSIYHWMPLCRKKELFISYFLKKRGLSGGRSYKEKRELLLGHLASQYAMHRYEIWIIDNAEELLDETVEIINDLLNLREDNYHLIQFVLFGKPQLSEFSLDSSLQFEKKLQLRPMTLRDVQGMVNYRFLVSGSTTLFSNQAIEKIYELSRGYPRSVVSIAKTTLKLLAEQDKPFADLRDIEIAANSFWSNL